MNDAPSFEDAVTVGMHALADGITRSFDVLLWANVGALLRRIAAWARPRPAQPETALKRA